MKSNINVNEIISNINNVDLVLYELYDVPGEEMHVCASYSNTHTGSVFTWTLNYEFGYGPSGNLVQQERSKSECADIVCDRLREVVSRINSGVDPRNKITIVFGDGKVIKSDTTDVEQMESSKSVEDMFNEVHAHINSVQQQINERLDNIASMIKSLKQ